MNNIYSDYGVSDKLYEYVKKIESGLKPKFCEIDEIAEFNQMKVLRAFSKNRVSTACLSGTTGYGYNDYGRETLEAVFADCFKTEAALVRPQIVCGTHALAVALFGNLRPDDELLSPVGAPYDTLQEVIGIRKAQGSLIEYGVTYRQVDLIDGKEIDFEGIKNAVSEKTKLVTIQRSRGYSTRPALSVAQIGEIIKTVKSVNPNTICMVDNCYGEFTEAIEPSEVGADMIVGSLIKNAGGGLCPNGGYICGTKSCVENAAARLYAPGLGGEVGPTGNVLPMFYEGLFLAPTVTASALKGAVLAAAIYESLGFECFPASNGQRDDIVEAINLKSPEAMVSFCRGIQAAAPIDSYVTPEPSDMPGYDSKVIMAAGTFVSGSSVELSADGPMREPYTVFFQGGITYPHSKLGVILATQELLNDKFIEL